MEKPSFEDQLPIINREIEKRRSRWTLTALPFEDVSQIVIIKIFKKYYQYKPEKGEFSHWVNKVISTSIKNILRDNYFKHNRPCIGCARNKGADVCSYTPSQKQCEECPLFAKWKKNKEQQFNVKQSLPLENHLTEAESKTDDFTDIDKAKTVIDTHVKTRLKPLEYRLYRYLYIENLTEREAGVKMDYKVTNIKRGAGYQQLAKMKAKILRVVKDIIRDEDLAL